MREILSSAVIEIDRPARWGKQLTSHLSRKFGGGWDASVDKGWIQLVGARVFLDAHERTLEAVIREDEIPPLPPEGLPADGAPEPMPVDKLEDVVGRHLVRFVGDTPVVVQWQRPGGQGTRQQNAAAPA